MYCGAVNKYRSKMNNNNTKFMRNEVEVYFTKFLTVSMEYNITGR